MPQARLSRCRNLSNGHTQGMQEVPSRAALSEKIVPATSGILVAMYQIVEGFAVRGTETKVVPPTAVPQVAEANAEAELTVALRTAFHSTSTDLPANSYQRGIGGGRRVPVNRRSTNKSRASSIQKVKPPRSSSPRNNITWARRLHSIVGLSPTGPDATVGM
jgi:hypothetical protein